MSYHGIEVGVDWLTLKVTSGPWWYKYLSPSGWTSCAKVAGGSHTILNLWADRAYEVDLFKSSGCDWSNPGSILKQIDFTTLSDINDWGKCWQVTDCRDIDNPTDYNNHTHKRQRLGKLGETLSGCDWSTRTQHSHGWPDGGHGQHWHCLTGQSGGSANATAESAGGQAGGASGQSGGQQPAPEQTQQASSYDQNGDGSISRDEALAALADYFAGTATRETATAVVMMYFASGS